MADILPKLNAERYEWLKTRAETDLLNLDDEVSKIGNVVRDVNENAALANEIRDTAKEQLEMVEAQCADILRCQLTPQGKQRSEKQIESEIHLAKAYQEAYAALSEARLDAGLWGALQNAIDRKSFSLQSAVSLISAGYLTMDTIVAKRRKEIRDVKVGPRR